MRLSGCRQGFTLLEIIITLVVAALVGLMTFTFVSHTVVRSGEPVHSAQEQALLKKPMEKLVAAYGDYLHTTITWAAFKDKVDQLVADFNGEINDITNDFDGGIEVLQVSFSGAQGQQLTSLFSQ